MADPVQKLDQQVSKVMGVTQEEKTTEEHTHSLTQQGASQGTNEEAMDKTDAEQEKVPFSEQPQLQTPSSTGRQRKKPLKHLDSAKHSDIDNMEPSEKSPNPKTRRKTPVKKSCEEHSGKKTPAKRPPKRKATEMDPHTNGEQKAEEETHAKKTPAKKTPAKKTPAKKTSAKNTPRKKTPAKNTPPENRPADMSTEIEEEPAKKAPKKKIARTQKEELQAVEAPAVSAFQENQKEAPEEPEVTPGGRPRRRAAKVALLYLHNLAKDVFNQPQSEIDHSQEDSPVLGAGSGSKAGPTQKSPGGHGKAKRRKAHDFVSTNTADDEDFVPDVKDDEEKDSEDEDQNLDLDIEVKSKTRLAKIGTPVKIQGHAVNGLPNALMKPIWDANTATKNFRDEHCNTWVFSEWIPNEKDWHILSERDSERYLPQKQESPAFMVSREGIQEDPPLQRLHRFESLPPNPKCWDMLFNTGGPVWAMDWCPVPDGAIGRQYAAIYSHRGQDDQHFINQTYTGPGLIQLWDLGHLEYNRGPQSSPALAYGLAHDKGCCWNLKWCPGGGWELPSTSRKAPLMPRLGLLAAATSNGHITIYSLPHPDTLLARRKTSREASQAQLICQAEGVITLKPGSYKTSHEEKSGQVLAMDWLPMNPCNLLAASFYDGCPSSEEIAWSSGQPLTVAGDQTKCSLALSWSGTGQSNLFLHVVFGDNNPVSPGMVALWDLSSKSVLLRIRSPDCSFTLYPYHCFIAHDNAVRTLSFCRASSCLLVTAGDDRMVKMWDLRKTYEPINSFKRFLSTEADWPLLWPGVFLAQENAYAPYGLHGLHYFDGGFLGFKPLYVIPRNGTMWSISMSDWLNSVVTGDTMGEVIFVLMPNLAKTTIYIKRTIDRRFPVYFTDMVLLDSPPPMEEQEIEGERAEEKNHASASNGLATKPKTFREMAQKYYLHYSDNDLQTLKNFQKRKPWKRMQATEIKGVIDMDQLPLASVHKVRFNPNLSCQSWVLSGGQAGLVRVHCIRAMNSPHINKMVQESQNQFNTMFAPEPSDSSADAVRHTTEPL